MKKIVKLLLCLLCLYLFAGCSDTEEEEEAFGGRLYYLNSTESQIVSEGYEPKADFKEGLVKEYIEALQKDPDHREYKKLPADSVQILDYSFGEEGQLILNMDASYLSLPKIEEVLVRAVLVKTFCQIDGISYVELTMNGMPYMAGDVPVGMMKANDFIDDSTKSENTLDTYLVLYFADESGERLLDTHRYLEYNVDYSLEQIVLEQLLAGPNEWEQSFGMRAVIPEGVKIFKANTKDGICYVEVDEAFLTKKEGINGDVVLYSIVNSLSELPNVNKVQFWINGEILHQYQSVDYGELLERNLDLLVTE